MRLRVNDSVQIHKVEVEMNAEHFSLMSLRKLKRDYGGDNTSDNNNQSNLQQSSACTRFSLTSFSADENSNETQKNFSTGKLKILFLNFK